jgi:hypothetical protein
MSEIGIIPTIWSSGLTQQCTTNSVHAVGVFRDAALEVRCPPQRVIDPDRDDLHLDITDTCRGSQWDGGVLRWAALLQRSRPLPRWACNRHDHPPHFLAGPAINAHRQVGYTLMLLATD